METENEINEIKKYFPKIKIPIIESKKSNIKYQ